MRTKSPQKKKKKKKINSQIKKPYLKMIPIENCFVQDLNLGHWVHFQRRCRRRDGQEFESDNDLPYHHHKRACLCLVCEALMQGENWYALALEYLCVLTMCDQHALLIIKQEQSEGLEKTLLPLKYRDS